MTAQILIVDDEPAIRRLVRGAVERAGYGVAEAATAAEALTAAHREGCELVLLDLGLPDRDGMELVPLIKAMDRAVIVLTARDASREKVAALDLGANDYVVKPFDTEELLARIRVALRHRSGIDAGSTARVFGDVTIDLPMRKVVRDGQDVALTRKEYAVLAELARHPGRVITHAALLRAVWGEAHLDDVEYLRVVMRGLRSKLEPNPAAPVLLRNEPGGRLPPDCAVTAKVAAGRRYWAVDTGAVVASSVWRAGGGVLRSTIKDVSRVAGVSIKTVSRVLNNERYVREDTRRAVQETIDALNFRPNVAARSLAGNRSFQIGLICDNPSPYYVFELQSGIRERCEAEGVRMIAQPYDRNSGGLLTELEDLIDAISVDGLILTPARHRPCRRARVAGATGGALRARVAGGSNPS